MKGPQDIELASDFKDPTGHAWSVHLRSQHCVSEQQPSQPYSLQKIELASNLKDPKVHT